jgi:hypothetical protein
MNLQKLAEKINERWGDATRAKLRLSNQLILVSNVGWSCVYTLDNTDGHNAEWIIWCLDRLEELGWRVQIVNYGQIYMVSDIKDAQGGERCAEGKTRAEAVTLALAKALGVEDE